MVGLVALLEGGPGADAGASPPGGHTPPPVIAAWTYPGTAGQATCRAPFELASLPKGSPSVVKAAFLAVDDDGVIDVVSASRQPCNGYSEKNLTRLSVGGRRVVVTVTGQGRAVDALLATSARRAAAIGAVSRFVATTGVSGVELDFEPTEWTPTAWATYMTFVASLARLLHGKSLEVDMNAWTSTPPDAERYLDPVLAGAKVVVMAFDHQYLDACSPIAPLRWLRQVVTYVGTQVPLADVTVGLPSYGYRATSCTSPTAVRDNIPYVTMAQQPGFSAARRDPSSGELRWRIGRTQYDCVDATALRLKLRTVEASGVHSVSVWSLGGNPWFTGDPS